MIPHLTSRERTCCFRTVYNSRSWHLRFRFNTAVTLR
jgi:hypothetical protein